MFYISLLASSPPTYPSPHVVSEAWWVLDIEGCGVVAEPERLPLFPHSVCLSLPLTLPPLSLPRTPLPSLIPHLM